MFTAKRLLVLLVVSILATALLYVADSDSPSDSIYQVATNTAVVFVVVAVLSSATYGLMRELKK